MARRARSACKASESEGVRARKLRNRQALKERRARLALRESAQNRAARIRRLLVTEIWPAVPPDVLGTTISREEEEEILGYGEAGV